MIDDMASRVFFFSLGFLYIFARSLFAACRRNTIFILPRLIIGEFGGALLLPCCPQERVMRDW